jgi:predicted permease
VIVADADVRAGRLDDAHKAQYFDAVVSRVSRLPGVESVSYGNSPFFMMGNSTPVVVIDGAQVRLTQNVMQFQGGPDYFRSTGIPLLRGRDFTAADGPRVPAVAIVNSAFARRFWPDSDALGHRISLPPVMTDADVVGVVDDGKYSRLDEPRRLAVFGAWKQEVRFASRTGLFVRTSDARRVLRVLQKEIPAVDAAVPVSSVRVLRDMIERVLLPQRLGSWLLGSFGMVALLLGIVGIHGLVAFLVAQRTHEIGIRVALGADRRDIIRLVLSGVMGAVAIGAALGTATVWWLSAFVSRLLFGVDPHDPVALAATLALLAAAAVAGSLLPVRRATRVDPMIALRAE